jgi:hypothetical protein
LLLFASLHSIEHAITERHGHSAHPCLLCTLAKAQAESTANEPVFLAWCRGVSLTLVIFTAEPPSSCLSGLPHGRAPPA